MFSPCLGLTVFPKFPTPRRNPASVPGNASLRWAAGLVLPALLPALCAAAAEPPADGLIASSEPGWPQWRGPRRDGISAETGLLASWPEGGPKLAWQADGLGIGWSSPIVVGDRVFITGDVDDDLVIYAFDSQGRRIWQAKNGAAWQGSYPGSRACCVLAQGRLYHLNAHGRLACLDAASGQEQWAVDILDRFAGRNITWALSECLLVDGDRVIVTPGGRRALMAALDVRGGKTVWTTPALGDDRATHASPILFRFAGRRVLAGCCSAHGFGVDADSGGLLWTVPLKNQFGVNAATPVYGDGCVFYVTPYGEQGRLYRLQADGREIRAEQMWHSSIDSVTGSATLVGNTLFAAGYRGSKWWFGIDWQTGQTRVEQKELSTGAAIFADDRLYVWDERGTAALLQAGPDKLEIAGRMQLVTQRVRDAWAHPVLCDGRLYLRYHDSLWCYDVKR